MYRPFELSQELNWNLVRFAKFGCAPVCIFHLVSVRVNCNIWPETSKKYHYILCEIIPFHSYDHLLEIQSNLVWNDGWWKRKKRSFDFYDSYSLSIIRYMCKAEFRIPICQILGSLYLESTFKLLLCINWLQQTKINPLRVFVDMRQSLELTLKSL